ncbi:MAG TPA: diguanylate cyclase [Burkholderiaceae bacterium]|nr:diguanylate cyclase [Burkholderiaceae bacterium]
MSPVRQPLLEALRAAHVRLGLAAVVAAGIVLTMVSLLTLRTYVEQNLQLVARSIAYTAEPATVFNDLASATETVALIAAQEGLLSAEIVRRDGSTLARTVRDDPIAVDATLARVGTLLFPLQATAPVTHQGTEFGHVTVQGNGGVYLLYLLKVVAAVAGCMAVIGWWVSRLSRRIENDIVNPLNSLASLTRTARTERSLGLRAPPAAVHEIHTLGEDFNALLAEIQSREAELMAKHEDLKTANESLSYLAFHDSLTGLPNRASFLQHAARAVATGRSQGSKAAVLYIDSDSFKSINDSLGHAAGDDVLIETARRIRALLRESDFVARLGGDEFAILLAPIRGAEDATRIAGEIAAALRAPVTSSGFGAIDTSASIGVAVFPGHGNTAQALLVAADAAMYRAKTTQPGSFCVFDSELDTESDAYLV